MGGGGTHLGWREMNEVSAGGGEGACAFKEAANRQHMASLAMPFCLSAPHALTHTFLQVCKHKAQLATVPCHSAVSVIAMGTWGGWCWHKKGKEIQGV